MLKDRTAASIVFVSVCRSKRAKKMLRLTTRVLDGNFKDKKCTEKDLRNGFSGHHGLLAR